jgi:phosphate starvation-inducible protein PhoH
MTTLIREYLLIKNLRSIGNINFILDPTKFTEELNENIELGEINENKILNHNKPITIDSRIKSQLVTILNNSQMKSVEQSCISNSFISLIHGPPGTGKTQVILGILSIF